jgi:hypothetical protein
MLQPRLRVLTLAVTLIAATTARGDGQTPLPAPAGAGGFDLARLADLDTVINGAIAAHKLPGAVVEPTAESVQPSRSAAPVARASTTSSASAAPLPPVDQREGSTPSGAAPKRSERPTPRARPASTPPAAGATAQPARIKRQFRSGEIIDPWSQ